MTVFESIVFDAFLVATGLKRPRGFAALPPEKRIQLGSKGGRNAHARGTANVFTPETGSAAGRVPHERGTARKFTSEEAREAGRKGGLGNRKNRSTR